MKHQAYPSKVLLFGEYTVLYGGQALAIPYQKYSGLWHKDKPETFIDLSLFFSHLRKINQLLHSPLDLNILEILENEYHYFSNIPQGVGLGSSAALSASIYDLSTNSSHLSLTDKKDDLAQIESFFHGKSSGFDPLVSLEGSALIQSSLGISRLNTLSTSPLDIYLLYTGIQRDAHLLIEAFQKRNTDLSFKEKMNTLAILSSDNIESFSKGNSNLTDLLAISKLQYDCLDFLIIPEIKKIWENSFKKADYAIKLCGAGGGGCYLLFTEKEKLPEDIQCCQLEKLDL